MRNRLHQNTSQELKGRLKVDPRIVVGSRLLRLQQHELEQTVEQELNDNPALERVEADEPEWEEAVLRQLSGERRTLRIEDDERYAETTADWTDFVASAPSLHDHLWAQIAVRASKQDWPLARLVVDAVDENGYLSMPPEEIALMANAQLEQVEQLVAVLKKCDPAGVGALDLRECLFLQLADADDRMGLVAQAIILNNWQDLVQRRIGHIARRYGLTEEEVDEAFARIASLTPHPGEEYVREEERARRGSGAGVIPDVVFRRTNSGVEIEIRGCDPNELYVNEWYRERYKASQSPEARVDKDEARHVREFVGRAVNLIRNLRHRRSSMRKIAECLLRAQYGFVTTGSYDFLVSLTRTQVARTTGMHESTVSRATMGKHVQIANGEVVPFDCFFKPALRIQKMIEDILQNENPDAPMTDREISEILARKGVFVARRTVSKHRESLRTLSSHRRRTA